jgi:hypothetical protein
VFTGIVHLDKSGTFWFDDRPVRSPAEVPRGRAWNRTFWYAPDGIGAAAWARIMGPQDTSFGPKPGQALGVTFKLPQRGSYKVMSASAWGVSERDPARCLDEMTDRYVQARACDVVPRASAAATAVQVYLDRWDGKNGAPSMRQLPCRWRGLAHAAMHGGPIAVLRGGAVDRKGEAVDATQIDVHRAYLAALFQEVPVLGRDEAGRVGGYFTTDDRRWNSIRTLTGFVDASVRVYGDRKDPNGLPPLAVHLGAGATYARGLLRGTWTIAEVRDAEERGEIEILAVHQYCFAPVTRPLFAEAAEFFSGLPQPLGKSLYQRFWGKLGSRGGFIGHKSETPVEGEIPLAGLWWRWEGIPLDSHRARSTYRPDLASFVCAHNHRNVMAALRRLSAGSVVAAHVDAVWTTDAKGAERLCPENPRPGDWKIKRVGKLRFYGIGCYRHGDHLAASGYDASTLGRLTVERLEAWIRGDKNLHRRSVMETRRWTSDPARDIKARSRPLMLIMDLERSRVEGPSVYDDFWTLNGWRRSPVITGVVSADPPTGVEAAPPDWPFTD